MAKFAAPLRPKFRRDIRFAPRCIYHPTVLLAGAAQQVFLAHVNVYPRTGQDQHAQRISNAYRETLLIPFLGS